MNCGLLQRYNLGDSTRLDVVYIYDTILVHARKASVPPSQPRAGR